MNLESEITVFTDSYLETLFWSEIQDTGEPMDDDYGPEDLAPEALAEIKQDCRSFVESNQALFARLPAEYDDMYNRAGHDFALTRNGHGAGFWDRGLGTLGDELTDACDGYGSQNLYVGDDGRVYV